MDSSSPHLGCSKCIKAKKAYDLVGLIIVSTTRLAGQIQDARTKRLTAKAEFERRA